MYFILSSATTWLSKPKLANLLMNFFKVILTSKNKTENTETVTVFFLPVCITTGS